MKHVMTSKGTVANYEELMDNNDSFYIKDIEEGEEIGAWLYHVFSVYYKKKVRIHAVLEIEELEDEA